jgi:hypothetical protein
VLGAARPVKFKDADSPVPVLTKEDAEAGWSMVSNKEFTKDMLKIEQPIVSPAPKPATSIKASPALVTCLKASLKETVKPPVVGAIVEPTYITKSSAPVPIVASTPEDNLWTVSGKNSKVSKKDLTKPIAAVTKIAFTSQTSSIVSRDVSPKVPALDIAPEPTYITKSDAPVPIVVTLVETNPLYKVYSKEQKTAKVAKTAGSTVQRNILIVVKPAAAVIQAEVKELEITPFALKMAAPPAAVESSARSTTMVNAQATEDDWDTIPAKRVKKSKKSNKTSKAVETPAILPAPQNVFTLLNRSVKVPSTATASYKAPNFVEPTKMKIIPALAKSSKKKVKSTPAAATPVANKTAIMPDTQQEKLVKALSKGAGAYKLSGNQLNESMALWPSPRPAVAAVSAPKSAQ